MTDASPYRILFVCLGNICRSPSGENIMNVLVEKAGKAESIQCDSAGTIDCHRGKLPDERMRATAKSHGYDFTGAARQVTFSDLEAFDLILAMDRSNLADLQSLDPEGLYHDKIQLFASYCTGNEFPEEVPDPYYGGEEGFHTVIKMVENGCAGLLEQVSKS